MLVSLFLSDLIGIGREANRFDIGNKAMILSIKQLGLTDG